MREDQIVNFLAHSIQKNIVNNNTEFLERMIEMTPTGKKRALLTEANILLYEAHRKLGMALEA